MEEFRCAPMTREQAIAVLKANREALEAKEAKEKAQEDERHDWELKHKTAAAIKLQRRFKGRKFRKVLLDTYRSILEQVVDPYSGKMQFVDLRTGEILDKKPLLFGSEQVHKLPDWALRYDLA